jgi:hypothetical protein
MLTKSSQVERTLQLWADGKMKSLGPAKTESDNVKPTIKAMPVSTLNPQTGVFSSVDVMFSAGNWALTTSQYMTSICRMEPGSLQEIVTLATPFMSPMKSRRQGNSHGLAGDEDKRACLVDEW